MVISVNLGSHKRMRHVGGDMKCDFSIVLDLESSLDLSNAMVGEVLHPGKSYSIHDKFIRQ